MPGSYKGDRAGFLVGACARIGGQGCAAVSGSSSDGDASAAALQSHHNVLVAMGTRRKEGRETLGDQND